MNDLAAEHVLLLVPDADAVLPKVRNAGAVFLGHWTAVPFGDYGVASNHVLPTAGHGAVLERAARRPTTSPSAR